MIAFIFVFAFIPGMFTPFQSNSDELTMTADRVGMTLVETILAKNNSGTIMPGIVDLNVFNNLKSGIESPSSPADYNNLMRSLGMDINGKIHNLQIIVEDEDGTEYKINGGITPGNENVGQSKRFVYMRDSNPANYPGKMAILTVRVW
ncbi:hypothetical protein CUJ83_06995 [Methanocella sp. CWC-04]|uniref:Uncharacterized protein n=1 Tax=Methanooceanicella nereidis TaxID=2052831 RepID=A0AAP2RCH0_9EURY|nr:hypothetical protein [Methanocella sp. CWC-04]